MRISARQIGHSLRTEGVQLRGKEAVLGSRTWGDLQEALDAGAAGQNGAIRPEDFSLRDLAAETIFSRNGDPVGQSFVEDYFDPRNPKPLQEAMGAVDATAFAGITGQLLINRTLQAFNSEEFIASKMVPTVPTRLDGERIPGVYLPSDPGEDVTVANEQEPLRYVGFGEEYVETPATVKRQLGIAVTREAIFFDRTGLVMNRASYVGTILGLRKEKNLLGVMIGATNTYKEKRKGDSAVQSLKTFYSATDAGRWTNHFDGNALTDWTNIDTAEQGFAAITDPNTGEPIILPNERLLFAPQIKFLSMNFLLGASQVWRVSASGLSTTGGINTLGPNPLQNLGITMATSRQLYAQLQAQLGTDAATSGGYWFYGDPAAFAYMENWPITVTQAPSNSEAEFSQDIVLRFKASERGVAAIMEPRRWQRHRTLATSSSSGT